MLVVLIKKIKLYHIHIHTLQIPQTHHKILNQYHI